MFEDDVFDTWLDVKSKEKQRVSGTLLCKGGISRWGFGAVGAIESKSYFKSCYSSIHF